MNCPYHIKEVCDRNPSKEVCNSCISITIHLELEKMLENKA